MYNHYICGLKISDTDYTVRMVEAVDINGNSYYDHKLTYIEKGKLIDKLAQLSLISPSELSSRLALESSSFPAGGNGDENTRIPVFDYKDTKCY